MAITYPATLPSGLKITAVSGPSLTNFSAVSRSPFTGQQQVYEWHQQWSLSLELLAMRRSDARRLEAFLAALRGRVGTVLLGPMHYARPRGTAVLSGVSLEENAAAGARTITLSGVGAAKTLLAGDYLQIGSGATARLHQVVEDATASAGGVIAVTIEPALRVAAGAGAAVVLDAPKGVFRLTTDAPAVTTTATAGGVASLGFEEAL